MVFPIFVQINVFIQVQELKMRPGCVGGEEEADRGRMGPRDRQVEGILVDNALILLRLNIEFWYVL